MKELNCSRQKSSTLSTTIQFPFPGSLFWWHPSLTSYLPASRNLVPWTFLSPVGFYNLGISHHLGWEIPHFSQWPPAPKPWLSQPLVGQQYSSPPVTITLLGWGSWIERKIAAGTKQGYLLRTQDHVFAARATTRLLILCPWCSLFLFGLCCCSWQTHGNWHGNL